MTTEKEKKIIEEINKGIDYSNGNRVWKAVGDLEDIKFEAGEAKAIKKVMKIIKKQKEPSNRWSLKLDNREQLAYFNGYEDTIEELISKIEELAKEQASGELVK